MHALSLPTWWIHISSVIEWIVAIVMVWIYARISGNLRWRALAWAMVPAVVGAMSALTWHWFDNDPNLEWIVTGQAAWTLVGNCALAAAAYWIWQGSGRGSDQQIDRVSRTESPSKQEQEGSHE